MQSRNTKTKTKYKSRKVTLIILALILSLAVIIYAVIEFNKSPVTTTASTYTKGNSPITDQTGTTVAINKSDNNNIPTSIISNNSQPLIAPFGDFISNHHPNLSGKPAPNTVTSVCSTTPGATCYITFTKGNIIRSLSKQTTDSGGGAYWTYTLQSAGLTIGSWQVKAIASLNGQTKTASDAMELTVSQ